MNVLVLGLSLILLMSYGSKFWFEKVGVTDLF